MKNKPKMTGGRGDTLGEQIRNEFLDKDSLLNKNTGSIGYEITNKESKLNQDLGKAFDPNKNGLKEAVAAVKQVFDKIDYTQLTSSDVSDALDPKKNGIDAALQKAGGDAKRGLDDLANKIKEQASKDKAVIDVGLEKFANEFKNPDSELSVYFKDVGKTLKENYFEDTDIWFDVVSVIVAGAALVVTAPIGGIGAPVAFAAMQAMIQGTKLISHAARGQPITPIEIASFCLAVIPAAGLGKNVGTAVQNTMFKAGFNSEAIKVASVLDNVLIAQPTTAIAQKTFLSYAGRIGKGSGTQAAIFSGGQTATALGTVAAEKTSSGASKLPADILAAQSIVYEEQQATRPGGSLEEAFPQNRPGPDATGEIIRANDEQMEMMRQNTGVNYKGLAQNELTLDDEKRRMDSEALQSGTNANVSQEALDLEAARQDTSSGYDPMTGFKLTGGSKLIDYVYNHTLHKRPRLDHDPSFFA